MYPYVYYRKEHHSRMLYILLQRGAKVDYLQVSRKPAAVLSEECLYHVIVKRAATYPRGIVYLVASNFAYVYEFYLFEYPWKIVLCSCLYEGWVRNG